MPGFTAVPMTGATLTTTAHSTVTHLKIRNVIGIVPGSQHSDDVISPYRPLGSISALSRTSWGLTKSIAARSITAWASPAFWRSARPSRTPTTRPKRSSAIICWILEKQGLLGSAYFSEHPVWPLDHIIGGINIDANLPQAPSHDLGLIGSGASEMEVLLAGLLKTLRRVIPPDSKPEKGSFYRSDHISLARVGVPTLDPDGWCDLIAGGKKAGRTVCDG
jgi:hypothetical protein